MHSRTGSAQRRCAAKGGKDEALDCRLPISRLSSFGISHLCTAVLFLQVLERGLATGTVPKGFHTPSCARCAGLEIQLRVLVR